MTDKKTPDGQPSQIAVREDLFTTPLSPPEQVRLKGSKCRVCGEVFLGKSSACGNCAGEDLEEKVLSPRGKLWTYTVLRNRPPGDYKGPDPFVPFALGLVEVPEGIRILSPLTDCDVDNLKIGMELELVVDKLFVDDEGNEVMSFKFKPI